MDFSDQPEESNSWSEPKDREIDGLKLVCTSWACPEQYDVFNAAGEQVGYLRLRGGRFRVDVPFCRGATIYESNTQGDGMFDENERLPELTRAVAAIHGHIKTRNKNGDQVQISRQENS